MKNQSKSGLFKSVIALCVMGLVLSTSSASLAWGDGGHMMVAFIAFKRLNPKARAQAKKLLAIPINPSAISKHTKDFVNASHWADDVKRLPDFEFSPDLHFIDNPFATDGTTLPTDLPKHDNIVKGLETYVNILKTGTDQNERAEALRFIIHFVGDIHQPLHCATRVDANHPEGDRGGNDLSIETLDPAGHKKRVKLHSYWDGGIESFPKTGPNFTPPPLSQIPAAAAKATKGNPDTDPGLKLNDPFNFSAWAEESKGFAQTDVYKSITSGQEPSAAYKSASLKIARKRVAWGGYRLAALLNAIWPDSH